MSQTKHLLPQVKKYFRTNLHTHTNLTDGVPSPKEMKQIYKDKGYSILSITDHNIIMDFSELNDEDFLMLTGVEYNINQEGWAANRLRCKTYHLNFIAKEPDNLWMPFLPGAPKDAARPYVEKCTDGGYPRVYDIEVINKIIEEANQRGFLVMYNHPTWSLQSYPDYAPLKGLWGTEIVNGDAARGGCGDRDNSRVFCDLVNLGNKIFPLGADDAHGPGSAGLAWIMLGAEKLEYRSAIAALEKGDFYASTGPEIYELSLTDNLLHIRCSDAQFITLESGGRYYKRKNPIAPDKFLREATFDITKWLEMCNGESPVEWLRLVVHGPYGQMATTRAYTLEELK